MELNGLYVKMSMGMAVVFSDNFADIPYKLNIYNQKYRKTYLAYHCFISCPEQCQMGHKSNLMIKIK